MLEILESRYDHQKTEEKIYALWEKSGLFAPEAHQPWAGNLKRKPFAIIMPPPNANGSLHLGHAVFVTLQDILIRFWRMRGRKTLWLPGADHAGFETQVVFDKKLEKEGRNRFEIPRDQLFGEIWEFTQNSKKTMESQLRKLGASCDWSREKFTLDPNIVKIVYETFEKLYKDGLAYRDNRIVNWCTKHQTTLSELETKYVEKKDPLYYIKYGPVELATVRPETKFGDTAVAVNPRDKRYAKLVGKEIEIETLIGPAKIKVIADEAVDMKFGTGAVKVTPAHDPNDFEIWKRHEKEIPGPKVVIDKYGRIDLSAFAGNEKAERYHGLKIMGARELIEEDMRKEGLITKIDPEYSHSVATCYKCGTTLEPRILPQWFIKTKPLAEKAIRAAEKKEISFHPESSKKVYLHWLKNIRDWNISRQIVWGIRIPAWYCLSCSEPKINPKVKSRWFLVRHGETDYNKMGLIQGATDTPLNETGMAQAREAGQKLKPYNIDLIVSSDLIRCRQTAEIIAETIKEETGAEILFEEKLRERHQGEIEGLPREKFLKNPRDEYSYEGKYMGAESYRELEERAWQAFSSHHLKNHHKNVVLVTHGGVMRMLIKRIKNLDPEAALSIPSRKNAEIIQLDVLDKCKKCGGHFFEQDSDVFDTWFSSGQWPFAALITGKKTDFKTYYPTDVMETGYDILFFWVARMVMLGLYATGKIPFKDVYLHGLVLDKDKKKMSKSKGNVIDPLGVAEIYGSDALRIALVAGNTAGKDIVISEDKIRGYRNFATKLWNIARFILLHRTGPHLKKRYGEKYSKELKDMDRKSLAEIEAIKKKVTNHLEKFEFHLAVEILYHYIWHTLADKKVESLKRFLQPASALEDQVAAREILEKLLIESLKMLHPFMPFITEEIYQKLNPGKILMAEKW
ncbi:MAG: class I tRNA ligase family protein [Candidatus Liptonbacteria bacterium]|nr:class I tRNA ligase family protein [Candidatus Liptonbacteria bacterium]